jgi:hypothetical protein
MHVKCIVYFDVFLMSCNALEEHVTAIAVPAAHAYLSAFVTDDETVGVCATVRALMAPSCTRKNCRSRLAVLALQVSALKVVSSFDGDSCLNENPNSVNICLDPGLQMGQFLETSFHF